MKYLLIVRELVLAVLNTRQAIVMPTAVELVLALGERASATCDQKNPERKSARRWR